MSRVYQALAAALADEGVDTVFCVMGDGNLDLLVELADGHGVRLVHARHEQGAVAMADGFARRTGRLGVAAVTHGPGLTQTATSLKVAATRRSSVLLLAGDTPTGDPRHIQSFEQAPFVHAVGPALVPLRGSASWGADLDEALARTTDGPVVFNLPTDHQLATAGGAGRSPVRGQVRAAPSASGVEELATALLEAERPVLMAGRGALGAETEVGALADRLSIAVVTTLGARGLLEKHPAHLGFIGGLGHAAAVDAVERADCVFAIGASLNVWTTKGGRLLAGKRLLRLDIDRRALDEPVPAELALVGDAAATIVALLGQLPQRSQADGMNGTRRVADGEELRDGEGCVDPRRALAAVEAALPADRTIVLDGGHFITFACTGLSALSPQRFLLSCDFATIGQGLAMAVGASVAAPDGRTTLVAGDGGLLMSIAELDTAVRYALPLNVVVLNDAAYGQELHSLAAKGKPTAHAQFAVPDLGAVARGFGADGHQLRTADDLNHLGELLNAAGGPRVIDIRINPEVVSPAAREIFRQVREGVQAEPVST
jgi:acetolactate synthase-1/2/3 large subunit